MMIGGWWLISSSNSSSIGSISNSIGSIGSISIGSIVGKGDSPQMDQFRSASGRQHVTGR